LRPSDRRRSCCTLPIWRRSATAERPVRVRVVTPVGSAYLSKITQIAFDGLAFAFYRQS
jgi:hypothetical protein